MKSTEKPQLTHAPLVLVLAVVALTSYMWMFLHAESQVGVAILIVAASLILVLSRRLGLTKRFEDSAAARPGLTRILAIGGALALIAAFHDSHFVLLMLCAVLLFSTACLGLTLQFGYSGVANFAGAAFFGIGSYATAVVAHRGCKCPA
jgi:hypothetical protein